MDSQSLIAFFTRERDINSNRFNEFYKNMSELREKQGKEITAEIQKLTSLLGVAKIEPGGDCFGITFPNVQVLKKSFQLIGVSSSGVRKPFTEEIQFFDPSRMRQLREMLQPPDYELSQHGYSDDYNRNPAKEVEFLGEVRNTAYRNILDIRVVVDGIPRRELKAKGTLEELESRRLVRGHARYEPVSGIELTHVGTQKVGFLSLGCREIFQAERVYAEPVYASVSIETTGRVALKKPSRKDFSYEENFDYLRAYELLKNEKVVRGLDAAGILLGINTKPLYSGQSLT